MDCSIMDDPSSMTWYYYPNFPGCSKNICLPTGRAERHFQGCSGMILAHSRRPSMAGFRGVRLESHRVILSAAKTPL